MENVIIRKVKREDIEDVVDIQVTGWQTAYKGIIDDEYLDNLSREEKIKKRKKDFDSNGFIVAEYENKVIGFCRYLNENRNEEIKEADCELLALYVKYEYKHKGVGTKLFSYVKEEFKKMNKHKMILWCLKENENAKKFYTKMGGKVVAEKDIEFGGKLYKEVAFLYSLDLI